MLVLGNVNWHRDCNGAMGTLEGDWKAKVGVASPIDSKWRGMDRSLETIENTWCPVHRILQRCYALSPNFHNEQYSVYGHLRVYVHYSHVHTYEVCMHVILLEV